MDLKVIKSGQRSIETAQTPGLIRAAGVSSTVTGAQGIWMGHVTLPPGAVSGTHHHGECETAVYIISGHPRFEAGRDLKQTFDCGPGDFVFVPPFTPHREINLSDSEPVEMIVARNSQENVVVAVEISNQQT